MEYQVVSPEWLKDKITKHNLTVTKFAELVGTTKSEVSAHCSGIRNISKVRAVGYYYFFLWLEK